jgi:hypothetical protein
MIKSPITGNNSEIIYEFNVKDVVNLYKKDFQLDVSRFFDGLDTFSLFECKDTGFKFYYPFNLAGDSRFYEDLSKDNKLYYPTWKWENNVKKSSTLLFWHIKHYRKIFYLYIL